MGNFLINLGDEAKTRKLINGEFPNENNPAHKSNLEYVFSMNVGFIFYMLFNSSAAFPIVKDSTLEILGVFFVRQHPKEDENKNDGNTHAEPSPQHHVIQDVIESVVNLSSSVLSEKYNQVSQGSNKFMTDLYSVSLY